MFSLIGFFTRIPVNEHSLEKASKTSYLLPIIGLFIGIIIGGFNYLIFNYFDPMLTALLTLLVLYVITGLNHLDGLADFGDAMYVSGTKEKKIVALKDVKVGISGTVHVLFVVLFLLFLFLIINGEFYKFIIAEMSAKAAILAALFFGKKRGQGMGSLFIMNLNRKIFPFSILFSLIISYFLLKSIGVIAVVGAIITSIFIVSIAHKKLGFVNGDVMGAINEISRVIALFIMVIL